ncbi:MAG: class I SAM-dependent methyltransferase [Acidobacteriota bacterium]|nr:class I SAM-dependent methyltransferase [Acidobacteriota bacterium]
MTTSVQPRKLDLGAGSQKPISDEWLSLDIVGTFRPNVLGSAYQLPFKDESLKAVKCHHVLEHIPRDYFVFHWEPKEDDNRMWHNEDGTVDYANSLAGSKSYIESRHGLIDVMNEMWRVLEPGGQAWIEVPVFPTEEAIADPTHGSFLVSSTFDYFNRCDNHTEDMGHLFICREDHRQMYGIKPWKISRREKVNHARILVVFMTKVAE